MVPLTPMWSPIGIGVGVDVFFHSWESVAGDAGGLGCAALDGFPARGVRTSGSGRGRGVQGSRFVASDV